MTARNIKICLVLFLLAAGTRFIVWQNNKVEMGGVQWVLTEIYERDAQNLASGEIDLFLTGPDPPSDANVLLHPPGYSLFIAGLYTLFGTNETVRVLQILLNSLSPVVIFLIAARLFDQRSGIIAGLLGAIAPQFAYHSGLMLPDALSVLPIMTALYVLTRAREDDRLLLPIICGVALGVSCWLRANGALLPLFFAVAALLWLPRHTRTRFASVLVIGFICTIAPISIRNYATFGSFVPLSLGSGTTLLEGLGDYDTDGRLEMPRTDEDVIEMDVRRSGRADYYGELYSPDGVERDQRRIRDGLRIIAGNPGWYAAAVAHRGLMTLRMERVPVIAPERDERETTAPVLYFLNRPLKFSQRAFITAIVLPLALVGLWLISIDVARRRVLIVLAIIPLYYMSVQALLHTEYRYVLATPHILFIFAALPINFLFGKMTSRGAAD